MEDNLKKNKNGRRPQKNKKWKTASKKIKDELKTNYGRQPKKNKK